MDFALRSSIARAAPVNARALNTGDSTLLL